MAHIRKRSLPSGKTRFQVIWEAKGKRVSEMFETFRDANAKRIAVENKMPMATSSFSDLASAYLADMRLSAAGGGHSHSYVDQIETSLNAVLKDDKFSSMRCFDIGTPEVQSLLARLLDRAQKGTVTKLRAVLVQTFNFATREGFSNLNPVNSSSIDALRTGGANASSQTGRAYVYFVQAINSGMIKIGFSNNPNRRLRSLATGSAEPLQLLGSFLANPSDEKALHNRFGHLREIGEWFRADHDLLTFIEQSTAGAVP